MSYKEIYKSTYEDSLATLEYVKNNLKYMGNIVGFKAFKNDGHEYYEVVDDIKHYYNLILFTEDGSEYWLYSNCGYSGTGPVTTCEILQLLGLREEYGIFSNEKIEEHDLETNHDLNLLITEYGHSKEHKVDFLVEIKFRDAYSRFKLIESLKVLGNINNLDKEDYRFNKYFIDPIKDETYGEYRIDQVMFLDKPFRNRNSKDIKYIIEHIISKYCESINIIDINCVLIDK